VFGGSEIFSRRFFPWVGNSFIERMNDEWPEEYPFV
jgi:hypothetical protein